ncbi:MAG: VWA domain-containing protein [Thalassotalea sp.]
MADFHFVRPYWLLAIALVFIIVYLLKHLRVSHSGWQQVIPAHLSNKLISGDSQGQSFSLFLPALIALLSIIALAGPAWQKLPQPVYNVQKGAVIIMDMSNSMYATDITPNRLTRARYKAIDLLEKLNEGDIGLIAYAGDSFVISPLTEDINNITLLLPALSPELMPVQGSNPLTALTMANEMLTNAGHIEGDIYWLTDDVDRYDVEAVLGFISTIKHRINILGIGTQSGAPITMPDGQLLKDDSGAIVIPHLTVGALDGLAKSGRGHYQTLRNDSADIEALVSHAKLKAEVKEQDEQFADGDQYQEAGPYLLLLILPLLLPYFRRGGLLSVCACLLFFTDMPTSYAQAAVAPNAPATASANPSTKNNPSENSFWQNLWQTQDQQAQQNYNQENYQAAAEQFTDPLWQGSSHYKNGDFEQALQAFKQSDSADAFYNQGNSLAKLGKLDEALKAYDEALKRNPNLAAAKSNKQLVEQVKAQQEQQQQKGDGDSEGQDSQEQNQDQNGDGEQSQDDNQGQSQDQEQQGENSDQQQSQNGEQSEQDQAQNSDQQNGAEQDDAEQEEAQQNGEEGKPADEQDNESAQQQAGEETDDENGEQAASAAQLTEAEQAAQEEEQKHQLLLNKVTDDPYLLLRNKMKLEHKKRRNQNSGVNKKW